MEVEGDGGAYSFINQNTTEWEDCGFLNKDGAEADPTQMDEDDDNEEGDEEGEDNAGVIEVLGEGEVGGVIDNSISSLVAEDVLPDRCAADNLECDNDQILNAGGNEVVAEDVVKPKQPSCTQVVVLPQDFEFSDDETMEDEMLEEEEEEMEEEAAEVEKVVEPFEPKYVEKTIVCLDHSQTVHGQVRFPQTVAICKLMKEGMVAKLVLYAEMSASRVEEEIRTAFAERFNNKPFAFKYLKPVSGQWLAYIKEENLTGQELLAMTGRGRIYIGTHFDWPGTQRPTVKKKKDAYGFINQSTTDLEKQGLLRIKEELVDVDNANLNNCAVGLTTASEPQEEEEEEEEAAAENAENVTIDEVTKSATKTRGLTMDTIKLDKMTNIRHVEFLLDKTRQPVIKLERLDEERIRRIVRSPSSTSSYGSSHVDAEEVCKEQEKDLLTEDKLKEVTERVEKSRAIEEAAMVGRQSSRASAVKARTSIAMMNELSLIGDDGKRKFEVRRKRALDEGDDDPEMVPHGYKRGRLPRRAAGSQRRPSQKRLYEEMSDEDEEEEYEDNDTNTGESEDIPLDVKKKALKIKEYDGQLTQQSSGVKKVTMTGNCDLVAETPAVKRIRRRMVLRGSPAEDIGDKRYASHIKCKFCGDHQRTLLHLYQHLSVAHPSNNARFECQECGALHTNATEMEEHMKVHCMRYAEVVYQVKRHGDGKFEYHCPVVHCKAQPMNWSKMINHLHYHRSKDCLLCGERIFPNPMKTFCTHVSTHVEGGPYVCPFCPKIFFNEMEDFRNHLIISHGGDPNKKWVCRFCYKTFERFSEFDLHLLGWHSNRPYCCQYCGQEFSSVITLEGHMERHDRGKDHDKLYSTCFKSFKGDKPIPASPSSSGTPLMRMTMPKLPQNLKQKTPVVKQLLNDKRQQIQVIRKDGSVRMMRNLEEVQKMAEKSTTPSQSLPVGTPRIVAPSQSQPIGIPRILRRQVLKMGPDGKLLPVGDSIVQPPGPQVRAIAPKPNQVQIPLPTGMSLPIGSKHQIFVLRSTLPGTTGVAPGSMQLMPLNVTEPNQQQMTSILQSSVLQHLTREMKIEPGNQLASPPKSNAMAMKITDIRSHGNGSVADVESNAGEDHMVDAGSDNDEATPIVIAPIQDKPITDGGTTRDTKGSAPSGDLKVCFHKHCFQVSQSAIDLWINHYYPKHFNRDDNLEFMCCQCAALYANYDWPPMNHSCKKPTFIHVCTDCGLLFQMLREKVQHFQQCKFFVTEQSLLRAGTPVDLLTCQYCLEAHSDMTALCSHILKKHNSVRFSSNIVCCEQCPVIRRFLDVEHLWEHNKVTHSEWWKHCGRWLCSYCGIDHTTEQEFNEHVLYSHAAYSTPHHFCSVCMDIFATRVEYDYHSAECSRKRKERMGSYESTPAKQATVIEPLEDSPPDNQQRRVLQPEMMFDADPTPLVITPDDEDDDSDDDQDVYIQVIQPEESTSPATTTIDTQETDQPVSESVTMSDNNCSSGMTSETAENISPFDDQLKEKALGSNKGTASDTPPQNKGTTQSATKQVVETISPGDQNGGGRVESPSSTLSLAISDVRTCPTDPVTVKSELHNQIKHEPGMLEEEPTLKCRECQEIFVDFESLRDHARLSHKPTSKLLVCPCEVQPSKSTMKWPHKYWQHVISHHMEWFKTFKHACTVCGELFNRDNQFQHHQIYQHNHDVKRITVQECIEMVSKIYRATKGKTSEELQEETTITPPTITTTQPIKSQSTTKPVVNQAGSAIMISSSDEEEEGPAMLSNKFNFRMLADSETSSQKAVTMNTQDVDHVCIDCGKNLPDLIALRRHQRAEHPMGLIKCEKCKQRIAVAKIKDHVCGDQMADVVPVFPCEFCTEKFAYLAAKNRHIAAKHRNQLKRCIACGKAFVTQDTLDKHTERMHPVMLKSAQPNAAQTLKPKMSTIKHKQPNTISTTTKQTRVVYASAGIGGTKLLNIRPTAPQCTKPFKPLTAAAAAKIPAASKQVVFSKAKCEQNWIMKNTMHQMYTQKCRYCSTLIVNWSENNRHEAICKKNPIFQEKKNLRALLSERKAKLGHPGDDYSEDESGEEEGTDKVKGGDGSHGGRIIALRHNVSSSDEEPAAEVVFTDNPEGNTSNLPPRETKSPEDEQQEDVFGGVDEAERRARNEEVFGPAKYMSNVLVDKVFQQEADDRKKMLQEEEWRTQEGGIFSLPQTANSTFVEDVFGPLKSVSNSSLVEDVFGPPKSVTDNVFGREAENNRKAEERRQALEEAVFGSSSIEPSSSTRSGNDSVGVQPVDSDFDHNTNQPLEIFPIGEPILNCSQPMGNVLEICPIAEDTVSPVVIGEGLMGGSDGNSVMNTSKASSDQNNETNLEKLPVARYACSFCDKSFRLECDLEIHRLNTQHF